MSSRKQLVRFLMPLLCIIMVLTTQPIPARAQVGQVVMRVGCSPKALVDAVSQVSSSGGLVTLELAAGCRYTLSAATDQTDGPSGLASIRSAVTVVGNGATIERSPAQGTPAFRLFHVASGGTLTLRDLAIINGRSEGAAAPAGQAGADGKGVAAGGGSKDGETGKPGDPGRASPRAGGNGLGGGIYNRGTLRLERVTMSGNAALGGAGGSGGNGGSGSGGGRGGDGVDFGIGGSWGGDGARGGNGAAGAAASAGGEGAGGAIYNHGGTVSLSASTLSKNRAQGGNGGQGGHGGAGGRGGRGGKGAPCAIEICVPGTGGDGAGGGNGSLGAAGGRGGKAAGGAIYSLDGGALTIERSKLLENQAVGGAGGNGGNGGGGGAGGSGGGGETGSGDAGSGGMAGAAGSAGQGGAAEGGALAAAARQWSQLTLIGSELADNRATGGAGGAGGAGGTGGAGGNGGGGGGVGGDAGFAFWGAGAGHGADGGAARGGAIAAVGVDVSLETTQLRANSVRSGAGGAGGGGGAGGAGGTGGESAGSEGDSHPGMAGGNGGNGGRSGAAGGGALALREANQLTMQGATIVTSSAIAGAGGAGGSGGAGGAGGNGGKDRSATAGDGRPGGAGGVGGNGGNAGASLGGALLIEDLYASAQLNTSAIVQSFVQSSLGGIGGLGGAGGAGGEGGDILKTTAATRGNGGVGGSGGNGGSGGSSGAVSGGALYVTTDPAKPPRGVVTLNQVGLAGNAARGIGVTAPGGLGGYYGLGGLRGGGQRPRARSGALGSHGADGALPSVAGGAVYAGSIGELKVVSSSIFYNESQMVGTISLLPRTMGGAFYARSRLSLLNSTLSGNRSERAGAIYSTSYLTLNFVTLADNTALQTGGLVSDGLTTVHSSILAGNPGGNCAGNSPAVASGASFTTEDSCAGSGFTRVEPGGLLRPFGYYGGGLPLYALPEGSPAVDAAVCRLSNRSIATPDQRDMPRPQGRACDSGAFELGVPWLGGAAATVSVGEGQTAGNGGILSGMFGTVTMTASLGSVSRQGADRWTWSYQTGDGPADTRGVTIRAVDELGAAAETSFRLDVANLAPTATFTLSTAAAMVGDAVALRFDTPTDSSRADMSAGFWYSFDCDSDGVWEANLSREPSFACSYPAASSYQATGRISDKDGGFSDYVAAVEVAPRNDWEPTLSVDQAQVTVGEGETARNSGSLGVPAGAAVELTASFGAITNNGDGTWSWSHPEDEGPASGEVTVTARGGAGAAQVGFTVVVENRPPTAAFVLAQPEVNAGVPATLVFTSMSDPGRLDRRAGYRFSFDCTDDGAPEASELAEPSFACTYPTVGSYIARGLIADKDGGQSAYTLQVSVLPKYVGGLHFAVWGDSPSIPEGTAGRVDGEYRYPEAVGLSFAAEPGSMLDNGSGMWSWLSTPQDGPASVPVALTAGAPDGDTATLSLMVEVVNLPPTARLILSGEQVGIGELVTLTLVDATDPSVADVEAGFRYSFDCNDDGSFEASDVSGPEFACSYQAAGAYTARGRIADKDGGVSEYTAALTVARAANAAPVAQDDEAATTLDTPVSIAVLANDGDPDGDTLVVQRVSAALYGAVTLNADGTLTYTPGAGFSGVDALRYTIGDGADASALTASAMVQVTVAAPGAPCSDPDPRRDLRHALTQLHGPTYGKATVVNRSVDCSYEVGLAAYAMPSRAIDDQRLFAHVGRLSSEAAEGALVIGPGERIELEVALPACAAQIDLFYGPALESLNDQRYGPRLLRYKHVLAAQPCG